MSQLAHSAAADGADAAAAEHEACTDTYASFDGAGHSVAVSDSDDEAALPPQTLLNLVPQLGSGGSGSVGCASGCGSGSGSRLNGHTAASGNGGTSIAAAQSALRTYEYHVLHSAAYGVPLLFLRGSHAGVDSIQLIASAADPDITSACACHCIGTLDCTAATGLLSRVADGRPLALEGILAELPPQSREAARQQDAAGGAAFLTLQVSCTVWPPIPVLTLMRSSTPIATRVETCC